jgi:hypothetical protein
MLNENTLKCSLAVTCVQTDGQTSWATQMAQKRKLEMCESQQVGNVGLSLFVFLACGVENKCSILIIGICKLHFLFFYLKALRVKKLT